MLVDVRIDYKPREWQRKCHAQRKRFTVLALHRRAGKTELAIMELIHNAIACQHELPLYLYVAPFLKQAKAIAWARLKSKLAPLAQYGAIEINEAELWVKFLHNGAMIRIYGADNPDAMRGVRLDGVVIDEVAQVKPEVWEEVLQPALSDRKGWALFIGTPHGINLFSELFNLSNSHDDWFSARYTVYDTHAIDYEEVERIRAVTNENSFAREYLCDFSAAGSDQLISLGDIEDAARRRLGNQDVLYAPVILGVDPARYGDDRSVIVVRQGLQAFPPIVMQGIDNMQLAARVASLIEQRNPDAVFVDAGAGSGVIDRLRQLGHDVIEIPFNSKASDSRYKNKRAEMWFNVRDWILGGGCIPNDVGLKADLAGPTYFYDRQGNIQLESKDEMKSRGLKSPDIADALALTFAYPVTKALPINSTVKRKEYNPYA